MDIHSRGGSSDWADPRFGVPVLDGARRSVVGEGDPGQRFGRGEGGAVGLGRHNGPACIRIGVHDGYPANVLAESPVADAGDPRHRRRPRRIGDLPGEDRRGLVRIYRDSSNATRTGVFAQDPAAPQPDANRPVVGDSERSISLRQGRAGWSTRGHGCGRR
jgi:hypothetical protein